MDTNNAWPQARRQNEMDPVLSNAALHVSAGRGNAGWKAEGGPCQLCLLEVGGLCSLDCVQIRNGCQFSQGLLRAIKRITILEPKGSMHIEYSRSICIKNISFTLCDSMDGSGEH